MLKLKITIKINVIKCALNFFFYFIKRELLSKRLVEHARIWGGGSNFFNLHSNVIIKNSIDPLEPPPPPPLWKKFLDLCMLKSLTRALMIEGQIVYLLYE